MKTALIYSYCIAKPQQHIDGSIFGKYSEETLATFRKSKEIKKWLRMNEKKTRCVVISNNKSPVYEIQIKGVKFNQTAKFNYVRSVIADDG